MKYDFIDEGQDWDEAESMTPPTKQRSRFGICPEAVLKCQELNSTARLVYVAIASFVRPGYQTFPSYNRIADTVKISRITAIRAVKALETAGFLKKEPAMRDDGGYSSNRYTLVSMSILPSIEDDTSPSINNDTTPSIGNDTSNNSSLKNNKNFNNFNNPRACARDNAAGAQCPAQTDLEDFVPTDADCRLLQQVKSSAGKAGAWLQLIRVDGRYCVRPASPRAFQFITESDFDQAVEFVRKTAGSCQPLKFGQHLAREIVINA